MNCNLVYLRPARLAFVRVTGPYETSIPEAWHKLFAWIDRHGYSSPAGRGYGLARDNPSRVESGRCRYDACVQLMPLFDDTASRELGVINLPGGSYRRERIVGCYAEISKRVAGAHNQALVYEDLRLDDKRPIVTIYLDDPRCVPDQHLRADLCLPVAAGQQRERKLDVA